MRVILVPVRLRLATALLFVCVPLAALETIIVTRAPWWHLPYRSIEVWSLAVLFICLPLAAWLMRGKSWAVRATECFFFAWLALNTWVAIRMRYPALGFFSLLLLGFFLGLVLWLRHELERSFFDPQLKWFQGLPKALPGLKCYVSSGERDLEYRVSRLDREGAFVFSSDLSKSAPLPPLKSGTRSELTFSFRNLSVKCLATPMRALEGDAGAGFQFTELAPDARKRLGDFIETLKGEGYVL